MRRVVFVVAAIVLAACAARSGVAGAQQRPDPPPYRILVSNDDGVRAAGIAAVAQVLQAIGDVSIVAPAEIQSGKGRSIVTSEPVYRDDLTLPNGMKAIGLTATPATTVNIAIRNIVRPRPDLVVSGINRGYNLAYSEYLAGTDGAAREGAIHGVPATPPLAEAATPNDLSLLPKRCSAWLAGETVRASGRNDAQCQHSPHGRRLLGYLVTTQAR
jgi:5'-nucleotidase